MIIGGEMIYQNLSEQLLLAKCSKGDPDAFQEIYSRFKGFVYGIIAARLTDADEAKDITQEIFINLWTNREKLTGINEFKPYLYVLSRNQVITAYRKQNIRVKGEQFLIDQLDGLHHSAEDHHLALELNKSITAVVEKLPETMRHCYHLSKNEGRKNGEIAGILNISEKTVRNNVSEAIKRLKLTLQNTHPELMALFIFLFLR